MFGGKSKMKWVGIVLMQFGIMGILIYLKLPKVICIMSAVTIVMGLDILISSYKEN